MDMHLIIKCTLLQVYKVIKKLQGLNFILLIIKNRAETNITKEIYNQPNIISNVNISLIVNELYSNNKYSHNKMVIMVI